MSDYKNFIARELGIRESSIKPANMDAIDVNPEELEMGIEDEKEHTNDDKLSKTIALHHLKSHPDYYSKLKNAGLDEMDKQPSARDRMMSPTARSPQVLGIAVRGSVTGGLPSGRDLKPSTLGGYEAIAAVKNNSELIDKTPDNSTINSSTLKVDDDKAVDTGNQGHPHQVQNGEGEPPQSVTGADTEGSVLTLKSAVPKSIDVDVAEEGTDECADCGCGKPHVSHDFKNKNDGKVPEDKLAEVRQSLAEKAAKGTMNAKETELFKTITEVLAKRGIGLEQRLFGKKSMLEIAKVPIKEGQCEDYPCCGHEPGGCPDENGTFSCTCGAKLPPGSRYSICQGCLTRGLGADGDREDEWDDRMDEYKSMLATNEVNASKTVTVVDKHIDKNLSKLKKKKQADQKKKVTENQLSHEEVVAAWKDDKSSGEYIGVNDKGDAYYHNKLIVPAERDMSKNGMQWSRGQSTGNPDWKGIQAWSTQHNVFFNVWVGNDHGNLELHTISGKPLGGLV